ncbi:hypothetical protein NA57DRAFT_70717 [Rhizodiscina lignyota]|uniref:Uncharacterized protein n=1 Tax=Rhizodiscina lignyota TaxID=1504668 RepID=A0A9P4IQZ6_9PEZI|nr:hypothetical protein NA57DRAFT_70717 [Rhizodiscina lignyota]
MAPLATSTLETLTSILLPRSPLPAETTSSSASKTTDALTATSHSNANFGIGSKPAKDFNNDFFLALFAIIGAAAALAAIWFFFWAKNGGFKFQEGDWDDYKSTVLRRKGPDGKTLSNATKSTRLGGGSVVHGQKWPRNKKNKHSGEKSVGGSSVGYTDNTYSTYDDPEQHSGMRGGDGESTYLAGRPAHSNRSSRRDGDLTDYRHEKVAKVGGLNRQHDGSHFDYSNQSDLSQSQRPLVSGGRGNEKDRKKLEKAEKAAREKARKEAAKREKEEARIAAKAEKSKPKDKPKKSSKGSSEPSTETRDFAAAAAAAAAAVPTTPKRSQPSAAYSFTVGDDASTHYTGPSIGTQEGSYYYSSYRPVAQSSPQTPHSAATPHSQRYRDRRSDSRTRNSTSTPPSHSHAHSRNGSPTKRARHSSRADGGSASGAGSSDSGTKVYSHHIPGLRQGASEVGVDESVSQVGARRATGGYRRSALGGGGAVRRRDSLSDSE